MRIIAGKFKNRRLFAPKGLETRPTSGKLRESVFNMLQQDIEGGSFLDVFAGSGGMGFEALSRGAERAVFLDKSAAAIECISKNIDLLGIKESATIIRGDVFISLEKLNKNKERFSIIYIDPPYATSIEQIRKGDLLSLKVLEKIDQSELLEKGGLVFLEESKDVDFQEILLSSLKFIKRRDFGRSALFKYGF